MVVYERKIDEEGRERCRPRSLQVGVVAKEKGEGFYCWSVLSFCRDRKDCFFGWWESWEKSCEFL